MKKLILVLALVFSASMFAQEVITKNLGDYDMVKVYNGLRVNVSQADSNYIEIYGERAEDVIVKNTNGKLKIYMNIEGTFHPNDVQEIQLYVFGNIPTLDANEGAVITASTEQKSIEIRAQEGAHIELMLDVQYLTAKATTGATIELTGNATNQDVLLSTGANYEAYNLITEQTTIKATTGAEAEVFASEYIKATASTAGEVYFKGNPSNVKSKTSLGAKIKSKK